MTMLIAFLVTIYLMAGAGVLYLRLGRDKDIMPHSLADVDWMMMFAYWFFWPITLLTMGIYIVLERPSQD